MDTVAQRKKNRMIERRTERQKERQKVRKKERNKEPNYNPGQHLFTILNKYQIIMHLLVPTATPQSRPSNSSVNLSLSVATIYKHCKHNKYSICTELFFFIG